MHKVVAKILHARACMHMHHVKYKIVVYTQWPEKCGLTKI